MRRQSLIRKGRQGFTLVELAVVIVIIGVLAAFGVPRFLKSVERSKAAEAFGYLSAVRESQERYQSQYGTYSSDVTLLDVVQQAPTYFTVGTPAAGSTGDLQSSWTLTLTRSGSSAGYGSYTVIFTESGYDATNSTIATLPDINPMGTNSNSGS
ncbi:MAG TPA: prepilin-type N-terminal cleavage/methylation domain-containing protein [Pirellulales bacterium]|nr:prepilin-type N-terminal cleavage/methylation domain-containing protein [Pirellulales bacterium]